jgi:NAD(P)-dependent dehydrogenase (short-subunit alcohol dehydrogenase family)
LKLEGRVAIVTGAAGGIGRAAACLLAREGARVLVVDLKSGEARETVARIVRDGGEARFCEADVSREDDVKRAVGEAVDTWGSLNILVNNAGINLVKFVEDTTVEEWDRIMAVNVRSMFLFVKHAVAHMRRAGGGSIVNVGSIGSFTGQYKTPAYNASKGAVLLFTKCLALDYGRDCIRVNCVCPGITDTPMLRAHFDALPNPDEMIRQRADRVPLNRFLQPEDVGRAIVYLASDDASGVTGTAHLVDGGILAGCEYSASWER